MSYASEGGHWYDEAGNPAYETIGKNGSPRPTTLRDAKKFNLVPSVTGILNEASAAPLVRYKINQVLLAGVATPRDPYEGDQAWMDRVLALSQEHAKKARDKGTAVHGCIEKHLCKMPYGDEYNEHVAGALAALNKWCGLDGIRAERSFAHPLGYGGKVDVHKPGFVADFKTKEFVEGNLPLTYDNHAMQLAAYREGFNLGTEARCAIVYVSTSVPGLTHLVEIDEEELERGWDMFVCLLRFWQLRNRYVPKICLDNAMEQLA